MPAIDATAYIAIKNEMGDIFPDVVETFLEFTPKKITELEQAITNSQTELVFNLAHTIKSSCSSISAVDLAELAKKIELDARQGSLEGASERLKQMKNAYMEVEVFLEKELSD